MRWIVQSKQGPELNQQNSTKPSGSSGCAFLTLVIGIFLNKSFFSYSNATRYPVICILCFNFCVDMVHIACSWSHPQIVSFLETEQDRMTAPEGFPNWLESPELPWTWRANMTIICRINFHLNAVFPFLEITSRHLPKHQMGLSNQALLTSRIKHTYDVGNSNFLVEWMCWRSSSDLKQIGKNTVMFAIGTG